MADLTDFSRRFTQLCKEAGLPKTQNALGKALGVSGTYVWKVRNGESVPAMDTAIEWAEILGVCVEYLMTGRGPKHPPPSDSDRIYLDITDLSEEHRKAIKTTLSAFKSTPNTPTGSQ